ncbi:MAG: class I SAM-dependent methyltransferase [Candidatus Omnitrophota bacterium]|nr:class I SAM-dependent methyltransferase [Candidatus Omnitrophota bacterium]
MGEIEKTKKLYGLLWDKDKNIPVDKWHFNKMQEVIPEPIVRGRVGIEIGSGCGYDTYIMAKGNPFVKIISLEISDGVYKSRKLTCALENVRVINGSASSIPAKDNIFDFAYSFGVLHHTPDPLRCLKEIARIIKKDAAVYLYLYEDHSENQAKHLVLIMVKLLRKITTRMPPKILYVISFLASPFIAIIFSYPSRFFKHFKITHPLSERMPFNFGTHPFSLTGDLYDRFGAPIEHRFDKDEVYNMFIECGFCGVFITRLRDSAGWVVRGYKQ